MSDLTETAAADAPTAPAANPEETVVEVVEDVTAQKDSQIAELNEQVKRISAEFENFRRRQQDEQKRRLVMMKEDLFRALLPVADNFDRTLAAARQNPSVEALLKGVELVRRDFQRIFDDNEIVSIPTEGATFDPALHEAMMVEERDDVPDQTVVAELQKGYKMGDRVLRPSMVKVSKPAQ